MELPAQVYLALSLLKGNGYESYIVGGCVRDSILGKTPNDYDITTNALPHQVKEVFENYKIIETGLKHGTVTVLIEGMPLEITTYRIDGVYKDHRRPENVTFTNSLQSDLSRRDFTINAMAYSPENGLADFFGGKKDLRNSIIACVGDAEHRFDEDGLRILRALRFASVMDFNIEEETSKAIFLKKELLKNIAYERISAEFSKLICGPGAEHIFREYVEVLGVFLPELLPMKGFAQNNEHHIYDVQIGRAHV